MPTNYRQRFEQMVNEVQSHPELDVHRVSFGKPTTAKELARAKKLAGGTLPSDVEAFYREMNGFSLEWASSNNTEVAGSIGIVPLCRGKESLYGSWEGTMWFKDLDGQRHGIPDE